MGLKIIFYVVVAVYAALMLLAGTLQFKNKSVTKISPLMMVIGSLLLLLFSAKYYYNFRYTIVFLVVGLILIHLSAIVNGIQMNGKLTVKHHIIRFILSVSLVIIAIL